MGYIVGMDVASGVAVESLQLKSGERVLDLCCAPGAKLCMIADAIGPDGIVLGVVSYRLRTCRLQSSVNRTYLLPV